MRGVWGRQRLIAAPQGRAVGRPPPCLCLGSPLPLSRGQVLLPCPALARENKEQLICYWVTFPVRGENGHWEEGRLSALPGRSRP